MIVKGENGREYYEKGAICNYNGGVSCQKSGRHCVSCGWCPIIDVKRREQAIKKYGNKHRGGQNNV